MGHETSHWKERIKRAMEYSRELSIGEPAREIDIKQAHLKPSPRQEENKQKVFK